MSKEYDAEIVWFHGSRSAAAVEIYTLSRAPCNYFKYECKLNRILRLLKGFEIWSLKVFTMECIHNLVQYIVLKR